VILLSKKGHGLRTQHEEFRGLEACEIGYEYHATAGLRIAGSL